MKTVKTATLLGVAIALNLLPEATGTSHVIRGSNHTSTYPPAGPLVVTDFSGDDAVPNALPASDLTRKMRVDYPSMDENVLDFFPLKCNAKPCSAGTSTWKKENYQVTADRIIIPCGKCITMDYDTSDTLILPRGLDIHGRLTFPDGYKLSIYTPFVFVQGELQMFSTRPVTDVPDVKITLTGTDEQYLLPADSNAMACSKNGVPKRCAIGKKPFVVAGGKLTIAALPKDCASWTNLLEVARAPIPRPQKFPRRPPIDTRHANPRCRSAAIVSSAFSSRDISGWNGGRASYKLTPNLTLLVYNRPESRYGPTLDLGPWKDCLASGRLYLVTARVRILKAGSNFGVTPTSCLANNSGCLKLVSKFQTAAGKEIVETKGRMLQRGAPKYGEWFDFSASITLQPFEVASNNRYHTLGFDGPNVEDDIELSSFNLSVPGFTAYPYSSNVCIQLVPNGSADADKISPFPFQAMSGRLTVQGADSGNPFFRLQDRQEERDSIVLELVPGCFVENSVFRVSALIRSRSKLSYTTKMIIRTSYNKSGPEDYDNIVATCSFLKSSDWNLCEGLFTVPGKMALPSVVSQRLQFEMDGNAFGDMDFDEIGIGYWTGPITSLILPSRGIANCWASGAEILITSYTTDFNDQQIRRIAGTPKPGSIPNTVEVPLSASINRPTTVAQSSEFAVEVALLGRNIQFEGAKDDPDPLHGAHFMVFSTPGVEQFIEGVGFRYFGQQGILGRYPIHFHMSRSVRGSIISKNTVRDSNQRCVVVHGTHNLTVSENIAYNTAGHCFMLEDGVETRNVFIKNLGALTRKVKRLLSAIESDDRPATFWASNPSNTWIGNVAAGSEDSGFWFELKDSVRGPSALLPMSKGMQPNRMSLKRFSDNVAHSNYEHGLRTYPSGFSPNKEAVFYNMRSFRNRMGGVFFHRTANVALEGGTFADNFIQVDFDRADTVRLEKASIIGVSKEYTFPVQQPPSEVLSQCPSDRGVIGIDLSGFRFSEGGTGLVIKNVTFSGFDDTDCKYAVYMRVDDDFQTEHFDFWTNVYGLNVDDDNPAGRVDFCLAKKRRVTDVFITDIDSSMKPASITGTGTSSLIIDSPMLTTFLDTRKCVAYPQSCLLYCPNTCLRTVKFEVNSAEAKHLTLVVKRVGDPTRQIRLRSTCWYQKEGDDNATYSQDYVEDPDIDKHCFYAATLPRGKYVARFVDRRGNLARPTFTRIIYETQRCTDTLTEGSVSLVVPDVTIPNRI